MLRPLAAVAAALLVASALAGCTSAVALDAAPDAKNAACASVSVTLLDTTIGDLAERETTAQGTAAWGDPTAVTLRCGVEVPAPSTLPCYELNGIYWLLDDSSAPVYRYTSFGRDPAVQVVVDQDKASTYTALDTLSNAVATTPTTGDVCSDAIDPTEGIDSTDDPTEPVTDAPTDAATDAATDASTVPPTDATTETPTDIATPKPTTTFKATNAPSD